MDELITAHEAAALLHLHVKRVQILAREGKLPAIRHGRKWLFRRSDLLSPYEGTRRRAGSSRPGREKPRRAKADPESSAVDISARNQLRGRIVRLRIDGVMAEVHLRIGDQDLVSVITSASAERLRLRVGDEVLAVVKSTEVMIARPVR
jgi:molybdopterin-binding protein